MRIGDYLIPTTVDWPGKCAMIVWLAGCNFRCPFCQNSGIIPMNSGNQMEVEEFKEKIEENLMWIDGVVFSGGEPTLQEEAVMDLASYIKSRERGVLIDTNGSRPEVLERMLGKGLVDRVSIDFKSAPERYGEVAGVSAEMADRVIESVERSIQSRATVEIRTTVVPGLVGPRDIEIIAPLIEGCDVYYLQQFRPEGDLLDSSLEKVESPAPNRLSRLARIAKKHVDKVGIKTKEFGVQYM